MNLISARSQGSITKLALKLSEVKVYTRAEYWQEPHDTIRITILHHDTIIPRYPDIAM